MTIKQPTDKSHFILPDLGEGVHEAELIRWQVEPGQQVEEHQTLAEMETDKALVEVPSPWAGTIKELHGNAGDVIAVGSKLVSYAAGSNDEQRAEKEDAGTVVGSVDTSLAVSQAFTQRREAEHLAAGSGKALATPAVRRIARELGVDIQKVAGSGRGGRVTAADVEAFAGGATTTPTAPRIPAPAPMPALAGDGIAERVPIRGVRRTIAESLNRSIRTAVHFSVTEEADVTVLDRKRREYAAVLGEKLSFLPLVMLAVCAGLRRHPRLNAVVDDAKHEILIKKSIHLGIAVDTEHGLMVPVITQADQRPLAELSLAVADVAQRSRDRTIPREELVGGTFTISNVGSQGGLFTTPIINYPEVAILGVGRVREQVLVKDGMFYAGKVMPLSLSCDHRVVDGAEGARFLNTVARVLERPEELLG
jgi:pyruvate dehydrogenase E2 component (dihydrolipoamide acetyltransferase)